MLFNSEISGLHDITQDIEAFTDTQTEGSSMQHSALTGTGLTFTVFFSDTLE